MRFVKRIFVLLAIALVFSSAQAFDLNALKKLAEDIEKSLPKQQESSQPKNSSFGSNKNFKGSEKSAVNAANTGDLGFCTREGNFFGYTQFQPIPLSRSSEELVGQYFNIDPSIAELQIRENLFTVRPIIGVTYPEFIFDGGIWSGEARSRAVELVMDPSLQNLATIIEAANQGKKGFGSVDISVPESKLILAATAIQLEPLLKDKSLPSRLLKESRSPGSYAGAKQIKSRGAFALSARWALIAEGNQRDFDNFILTSLDRQGDKFESSSAAGSRRCLLCQQTVAWAATGGIPGWRHTESYQEGLRLKAQFDGNKPDYNPPNWSSTIDEYRAFAESLNNQTDVMFTKAKGQTRAVSKGREAARISREGQNTYGAVPDPDLDSAIVVLQTETPKALAKDEKAALKTALKDRLILLRKIDVLDRNLADALFSFEYSFSSLDEKALELLRLQTSSCLVAFAERRAARASDISMPSSSDVSAEEAELR
jgi:hypothetical protein